MAAAAFPAFACVEAAEVEAFEPISAPPIEAAAEIVRVFDDLYHRDRDDIRNAIRSLKRAKP